MIGSMMNSLINSTLVNIESLFEINKVILLLILCTLIFTRLLDVVFSKMNLKKDIVYIYEVVSLALIGLAVFSSREIVMIGGSLLTLMELLYVFITIVPVVILSVTLVKYKKRDNDIEKDSLEISIDESEVNNANEYECKNNENDKAVECVEFDKCDEGIKVSTEEN